MGKIAFVFPGQGAQHIGMGKEIYDAYPVVRDVFNRATEALGYDMANLCFESEEEKLRMTEFTQPSILTVSYAIAQVLLEHGVKPDYVAGLSLGEYSGLVLGEAMAFEDALRIVTKRGQFMQEAVPKGRGTMAAILGLSNESVESACEEATSFGVVQAVNYNCPGQLVIAGEVDAVEKAVEIAKERGAKKAMLLPVSAPFHTSLLKPAGDQLKKELDSITISELKTPLVNNVMATYTKDASETYEMLVRQVSSPVRWEASIRRLIADGVDTFIEVGPGKSLNKFIKRIDKTVVKLNVEDIESLKKTLEALEVHI